MRGSCELVSASKWGPDWMALNPDILLKLYLGLTGAECHTAGSDRYPCNEVGFLGIFSSKVHFDFPISQASCEDSFFSTRV